MKVSLSIKYFHQDVLISIQFQLSNNLPLDLLMLLAFEIEMISNIQNLCL